MARRWPDWPPPGWPSCWSTPRVGADWDRYASPTKRHNFYDNTARAINNSDLDGALLWNLGTRADRTFTVAYGDVDSERVLGAWSSTIHKNATK